MNCPNCFQDTREDGYCEFCKKYTRKIDDTGLFSHNDLLSDESLKKSDTVLSESFQEEIEFRPFDYRRNNDGTYGIKKLIDMSLEVTVPNGVVIIGPEAFMDSGVTKVELPEGLKQIGAKAFKNCHYLSEITIPESVETIGEEAFANDEELLIDYPIWVKRIGKSAFSNSGVEKKLISDCEKTYNSILTCLDNIGNHKRECESIVNSAKKEPCYDPKNSDEENAFEKLSKLCDDINKCSNDAMNKAKGCEQLVEAHDLIALRTLENDVKSIENKAKDLLENAKKKKKIFKETVEKIEKIKKEEAAKREIERLRKAEEERAAKEEKERQERLLKAKRAEEEIGRIIKKVKDAERLITNDLGDAEGFYKEIKSPENGQIEQIAKLTEKINAVLTTAKKRKNDAEKCVSDSKIQAKFDISDSARKDIENIANIAKKVSSIYSDIEEIYDNATEKMDSYCDNILENAKRLYKSIENSCRNINSGRSEILYANEQNNLSRMEHLYIKMQSEMQNADSQLVKLKELERNSKSTEISSLRSNAEKIVKEADFNLLLAKGDIDKLKKLKEEDSERKISIIIACCLAAIPLIASIIIGIKNPAAGNWIAGLTAVALSFYVSIVLWKSGYVVPQLIIGASILAISLLLSLIIPGFAVIAIHMASASATLLLLVNSIAASMNDEENSGNYVVPLISSTIAGVCATFSVLVIVNNTGLLPKALIFLMLAAIISFGISIIGWSISRSQYNSAPMFWLAILSSVVLASLTGFHAAKYPGYISRIQPSMEQVWNFADTDMGKEYEKSYKEAAEAFKKAEYGKAAVLFSKLNRYKDAEKYASSSWDNLKYYLQKDAAISANEYYAYVNSSNNKRLVIENILKKEVSCPGNIISVAIGMNNTDANEIINYPIVLLENGKIYLPEDKFITIPDSFKNENIVSIAAGCNYVVVLYKDGTVGAFGDNSSNQCDVGDWKNVVSISSQGNLTLGVTYDGKILFTGIISEIIEKNLNLLDNVDHIASYAGYVITKEGNVIATGPIGTVKLSGIDPEVRDVAFQLVDGSMMIYALYKDKINRYFLSNYECFEIDTLTNLVNPKLICNTNLSVLYGSAFGSFGYYDHNGFHITNDGFSYINLVK